MLDTALSLMMLSSGILLWGAWFQWRRRGMTRQAVLMAVMAAILLANVAIWTIPTSNGTSLTGLANSP